MVLGSAAMAPLTRRQKKALAATEPKINPADRLSQLPEAIQAQILSFLPAEEAVRTCVLARTWRNVWKLTRRLLITGHEHQSVQEVCGFVDHLLPLRLLRLDKIDDYAPIDACEILFPYGMYNRGHVDELPDALQRWIPLVLECQVKLLRVDCRYLTCLGPIRMLDEPLVSQHLTTLFLGGLWFFETGPPSGLDFSDCPALQHLEITACDMENVTEMTSPSVKRLVITDCYYVPSVDPLRFCFPLVVSLRLEDLYDNTIVLESMPQLAEAYVSIDENHNNSDDDEEDVAKTECLVIQVLAEAEHLVLLSDHNTITFTRGLRFCPTFSKLKTLVLNHYWCDSEDCNWCESEDCNALACILQHAPVLEKLTVLFSRMVESKYNMVVELRPRATGNSTVISQHLKIIELKYSKVNARVVKVQIFLGTLNIRFQVRVTEGSK